MDIVQDIKDRLNIEDVVAQYVQLKRAGQSLKGLCPFHNEKTPSFVVSPEKGIAYCFGCHKGGDIFAFVQEAEHVDFQESIKILADRAGLNPDTYKTAQPKVKKSEKDEMFQAHTWAVEMYQDQLFSSSEGKKVVEYLLRRGLKEETIRNFGLGYAPESGDALHSFLIGKGISKKTLIESGLVNSREISSDRIYDRFRMRLMFPIADVMGRVIAFGGRALKKEMEPKYLNSPESPLYHKSHVLYLLDKAKASIKSEDRVMLVEGYVDALMCHQAGIASAVATSGTALTADHMKLLKKYTHNVLFCFDQDNAGFDASVRAFLIALPFEMNVRVVTIPVGKDPADAVKTDVEMFVKAVSEAQPFLEFYFDHVFRKYAVNTLEGSQQALQHTLPFIEQISSPVMKDFYIRELALRMGISESQIYDEISRSKLPTNHPARRTVSSGQKEVSISLQKFSLPDHFISLLLQFPDHIPEVSEKLSLEALPISLQDIYKWLLEQYNTGRSQVTDILQDADNPALRDRVMILSLLGEERYGSYSPEMLNQELQRLSERLIQEQQKQRQNELKSAIRQAEISGNKGQAKELLQQLQQLL